MDTNKMSNDEWRKKLPCRSRDLPTRSFQPGASVVKFLQAMKIFLTFLALALVSAASAQTAIAPGRAVKRLDLPPPGSQPPPPRPASPAQNPPLRPSAPAVIAPAKPAEIVAKIESGLAASPLKVIGTTDGLLGKIYVTNLTQQAATPTVQLAVLDRRGVQIGSASKAGAELEPGAFEKIEVLSADVNAGNFKLMKLSGATSK